MFEKYLHDNSFLAKDVRDIEKIIKEHNYKKKEIHLNPGEAIIWHANLLHGGSPVKNADGLRRK